MKTRIFKSILIVLSIFLLSINCIFADTEQNRTLLNDGWQLFSSENKHTDGAIISSDGFDSKYGYPIMLPSTVMNGLIQNNRFPDICRDRMAVCQAGLRYFQERYSCIPTLHP